MDDSLSPDPRVAVGDHGWWCPEKGVDENLRGFTESRIHVPTSNSPPCSHEMGDATVRGTFCRAHKEGIDRWISKSGAYGAWG